MGTCEDMWVAYFHGDTLFRSTIIVSFELCVLQKGHIIGFGTTSRTLLIYGFYRNPTKGHLGEPH